MNKVYFLIIFIFGSIKSKNSYDYLLEWGKNNSLEISDKLGMRYSSENNKTYYAKDEIPEHTIIMNIPFKIMLNINNALKLLNNKKLSKLYTEYKKNKFRVSIGFLPASVDQSFLTYLIYLAYHRQKHYKKNKFYLYFHYLIDTFETNLDNFPIFYNNDQFRLLQGSLSFMESSLMKELFKEEVNKLEDKHNQKSIDLDEYLRFRTLTITKSLNITNITSIVPFLDMFATDPIDYNVNLRLNNTNKNIIAFTTKKIKRGDILYLRTGNFSNIKRFILYGETFEKMNDYVESFPIPIISPKLYKTIYKDDKIYNLDETINLNEKKFYKDALKSYKNFSISKKEDGSDLSAYRLFLKNLEIVREDYNYITTTDIYKQFVNLKDIYNVKRVLDLEKKFLDEKINVLRKFVNKLEKKSKKKSEEKSEEKNKDL